jgi:hypothetical protein
MDDALRKIGKVTIWERLRKKLWSQGARHLRSAANFSYAATTKEEA